VVSARVLVESALLNKNAAHEGFDICWVYLLYLGSLIWFPASLLCPGSRYRTKLPAQVTLKA